MVFILFGLPSVYIGFKSRVRVPSGSKIQNNLRVSVYCCVSSGQLKVGVPNVFSGLIEFRTNNNNPGCLGVIVSPTIRASIEILVKPDKGLVVLRRKDVR